MALKRTALADARGATQKKVVTCAAAASLMLTLLRDVPLLLVPGCALALGLGVHAILRYRRLRVELGLEKEYDELAENSENGAKTFIVLFAVLGGFMVFLAAFVTIFGKR